MNTYPASRHQPGAKPASIQHSNPAKPGVPRPRLHDARTASSEPESRDHAVPAHATQPQLEARPATTLKSMAAGAGTGMVLTRLLFPGFEAMMLGAIGGAAAGGLVYTGGNCLLACYRNETSPDTLFLRDVQPANGTVVSTGATEPDIVSGSTIAVVEPSQLCEDSTMDDAPVKTVRFLETPKSTPRQQRAAKSAGKRQPVMRERVRDTTRVDCLARGAIGCGLLTGLSTLIVGPVTYLVLNNNPVARTVVATVPVLVPLFFTVCLGCKAMKEYREGQEEDDDSSDEARAKDAEVREVVVGETGSTTEFSEGL